MAEAGVDIAGQRAKHVDAVAGKAFDAVVTVCDQAREACPVFPHAKLALHAGFDDPPRLAAGLAGDEALIPYRRVRDEIRAFVETLPARLDCLDRSPEPARPGDLSAAVELVREAGLPTEGIADFFPAGYSVVRNGAGLVAVAGLETHDGAGLLRSVAVASSWRGAGVGRSLVDDRLAEAKARGLDSVYLLTTTAARFFRGLGFVDVPRASAPASLLASSEFSSTCPSSAMCLMKSLR